jgi:hypothetical protein
MARIRFACVHCKRPVDAGEECGCQKNRASPMAPSEPAAAPPAAQKRPRSKKTKNA